MRSLRALPLLIAATALPARAETAPQLEPPVAAPGDAASAPAPSAPRYTVLRYTERYDYLADPAQRREPLDAVKYIPLDGSGIYPFLSLGGELRERYEWYRNRAMGLGANAGHDDYLLQRLALHADLHFDPRARIFIQGLSALETGQRGVPAATNQNPIDLQQAFVDGVLGDPDARAPRFTLRGGRFALSLGAGRLVATRAGPNVPYKFDGTELIAAQGERRLYAFLVRPGEEVRYGLDGENDGQAFWGSYATAPVSRGSIDFYYLGFRDNRSRYFSGRGTTLRHTLGTRWAAERGLWSWDWEPVFQFGRFDPVQGSSRPLQAWTLATETTRRLPALPWQARLGLKLDYASGDGRGATLASFDPLFFKSGYFNDATLLRPSNLFDVHPTLSFTPRHGLNVSLGADWLWRARRSDGIYGNNGALQVAPTAAGRAIGTTAEAAVQWSASRHWTLGSSYVHLFASDALRGAGGRNVDFLQMTVTLLW